MDRLGVPIDDSRKVCRSILRLRRVRCIQFKFDLPLRYLRPRSPLAANGLHWLRPAPHRFHNARQNAAGSRLHMHDPALQLWYAELLTGARSRKRAGMFAIGLWHGLVFADDPVTPTASCGQTLRSCPVGGSSHTYLVKCSILKLLRHELTLSRRRFSEFHDLAACLPRLHNRYGTRSVSRDQEGEIIVSAVMWFADCPREVHPGIDRNLLNRHTGSIKTAKPSCAL
jgi:hypothetical protein